MKDDETTEQDNTMQDIQEANDTPLSGTSDTEARDTMDTEADNVADGDEGQVKSRDPEYYGDR